jgi:hypothetical protein
MSLVLVTGGNLVGALLVAYLFAVKTGVIGGPHSAAGTAGALTFAKLATVAKGKAVTETSVAIFLRAIGCNWLVCLAVWMAYAAEDIAGKILAIFFPIMAFVALGFDHVVANMFFIPAAMFARVRRQSGGRRLLRRLVLLVHLPAPPGATDDTGGRPGHPDSGRAQQGRPGRGRSALTVAGARQYAAGCRGSQRRPGIRRAHPPIRTRPRRPNGPRPPDSLARRMWFHPSDGLGPVIRLPPDTRPLTSGPADVRR